MVCELERNDNIGFESDVRSSLKEKPAPDTVSQDELPDDRLDPLIPELINLTVLPYDKLHNEGAQGEKSRTKNKHTHFAD